MFRGFRSASLFLLLSLLLPAAARPAGPASSAESFTDSIDVRVVNVEAVVTDRHGQRVRGLAPSDFRLLVDGKEVPVGYFTEVAAGTAVAAPAGARAVAAPAEGRVGRSVLVFVDQAFAIGAQLDFVLDRVRAAVDRLEPEDRVAVVAFDGRKLAVLADWTGDRAAVRAALGKAGLRGPGGADVRAERDSAQADRALRREAEEQVAAAGREPDSREARELLEKTVGPDSEELPETRIGRLREIELSGYPWKAAAKLERTLSAAMAALRAFSGTPGRKTALLLSGGWPAHLQPQLFPQVVDTANRLGYTLYPVDVPGIESSPVPVAASEIGPPKPGQPNTGLITSAHEQDDQDGLEMLARWTGGRASLNSARLASLDRLVEDTASYYWLGFSPVWRGDGRRHAVRLEVRKPGLQVRSRRSFTDLSPAAESAMALEGRLLLGRDVPEPALTVQLGAARWGGLREVLVPLTLGIPAGAVQLVATGDGYRAELPLHVSSFDSTGTPVELPPVVLRVTVRQPPPAGELLRFDSTLRIRRGEQRLRFVVQDAVHDKLLLGEAPIGRS